MKIITRDILITLILKILLLFVLWFVCFNKVKHINTALWLTNSTKDANYD